MSLLCNTTIYVTLFLILHQQTWASCQAFVPSTIQCDTDSSWLPWWQTNHVHLDSKCTVCHNSVTSLVTVFNHSSVTVHHMFVYTVPRFHFVGHTVSWQRPVCVPTLTCQYHQLYHLTMTCPVLSPYFLLMVTSPFWIQEMYIYQLSKPWQCQKNNLIT